MSWCYLDVKRLAPGGVKEARLVAQGHTQKAGIDYNEIFAPVIKYESFQFFFFALAACFSVTIH